MPDLKRDNLINGRYRLQQSLGRGSFGEVFYAEDTQFDPPRAVALKLLHPQYTLDAQVREDLKREAGILARFDHPNILNVLDFGINEEIAFIVMELAQGGSLARRLRPDLTKPPAPLPLPEVATYLDQMADALDEAHDQGLIHRDIKPQNILLDRRGRILVADFGLATAVTGSSSSVMVDTSGSGTPLYMSPEQWQGRAGRASDIYSLGAVLFQMVSGHPPYQGNQFELFGQHLNLPTPRLSEKAPDLAYPPELDNLIAHAMAKDPRQRIRPAKELARSFRVALENWLPPNSQPTVGFMPVQRPPTLNRSVAPNNQPGSNTNYGPGTSGSPGYQAGSSYQPAPGGASYSPGAGSSYQPGANSGASYPNNYSQPGQTPPRPYENRPDMGTNTPASYQGFNPAATSSFSPYAGPPNQPQPVSPPSAANQSRPVPAPVAPPVVPVAQPAVVKEKKGLSPLVWIIALILVLLVVGGIAFVVLSGNKTTGPTTGVAQVTNTPSGGSATSAASTNAATTAVATTNSSATTAPVTTPAFTTTAQSTGATTTTQAATTAASETTAIATSASATTLASTTIATPATPAPFGTNIATFKAHDNIVLALTYSPDGKTFATASESHTVKIWDASDNHLIATLSGHTGPVRSIAFSPNGKLLVSGSADKTARVWDLSSKSVKYTLTGQSDTVTSVAFNPDGNSVATGSDDHTVFLYNLEDGQKFGATFNNLNNVTAIAYSPDGKTLVAGLTDGAIKLWDLTSTKEKPAPDGKGHSGTIWSLTFSHNGKFLASGSLDRTTRLWNVNGDKVSLAFVFDDSAQGVRQVAFSPDDKYLASACDDKTVYLWDTVNGTEAAHFTGFQKEVYAVAISPDGKTLVSGSADGMVKTWSLVK